MIEKIGFRPNSIRIPTVFWFCTVYFPVGYNKSLCYLNTRQQIKCLVSSVITCLKKALQKISLYWSNIKYFDNHSKDEPILYNEELRTSKTYHNNTNPKEAVQWRILWILNVILILPGLFSLLYMFSSITLFYLNFLVHFHEWFSMRDIYPLLLSEPEGKYYLVSTVDLYQPISNTSVPWS